MAIPALGTYEYQFKDNGVRLNGDVSYNEGWVDIQKITGLDMPPVIAHEGDLDGMHGGFIDADFVGMRTIVLEGTVYAPVDKVDDFLDDIVGNFLPSREEFPFYVRQTSRQVYMMCKSLGVRFDVDNLRGSGRSSIQIQLICPNPIKRYDNLDVSLTAGDGYKLVPNIGNVATYNTITIPGPFTEVRLQRYTFGFLTLLANVAAGSTAVINMRNRSVRIDGVQQSGSISGDWWVLPPDGANIRMERSVGGTPTAILTSYSGWL